MRRRAFLIVSGTALAGTTAGCLGSLSGPPSLKATPLSLSPGETDSIDITA